MPVKPVGTVLNPVVEAGRPAMLLVTESDSEEWLRCHGAELRALVDRHGAVLVRGLGVSTAGEVRRAGGHLFSTVSAEFEGFAERDILGAGVYSGTKWPSNQPMCMHHELSYARNVPRMLLFGCLRAPSDGGETALADAQEVFRSLPGELTSRFATAGWRMDRNYNGEIGVDWRAAFRTSDREEVARYCTENDISFQWTGRDSLRTTQCRPAVVTHPKTGAPCWFNQIAFLNEWTMEPAVREYLIAVFGADSGLPFNTFSGDGTPLDEATVNLINDTYDAHTVQEAWRDGDLMLVDNIRMAHSRLPYHGDREIAVVFGEAAPMP